MTKVFSPQFEDALNDAIDAPVIMSAEGRPSLMALTTDLFEVLCVAIGEEPAAFNPRTITRDGKSEITLLHADYFRLMNDAFHKVTMPRAETQFSTGVCAASSDIRIIRPLPRTYTVDLQEELFYADLRMRTPGMPAWEDLTTPQRDIVLKQMWDISRAVDIARNLIVRAVCAK